MKYIGDVVKVLPFVKKGLMWMCGCGDPSSKIYGWNGIRVNVEIER